MKTLLFTTTILLCTFCTMTVHAKTTYSVAPAIGTGVDVHKLEIFERLVRNEVAKHSQATLVEKNAHVQLFPELTRLEHTYILIITAEKEKTWTQTKKAKLQNFDELDTGVARVVSAIIEGKEIEQTAERGTVLKEEQDEPTRVKSISCCEIALGAALPFSDALRSHKTMYALGIGYMWDINDFLVELRSDLQFGMNDARMNASSFSVGGHYVPINARTTALYTGVDLGFVHIDDNNTKGKSGFGIAGNVGVLFFRHADINVDVRFRTMVIAY